MQLPGIALLCVLSSYFRAFHSLLGLLLPSVRDSVQGFDDIRAAGKYWVKDRMEKTAAKKVDRSDLLAKFFKIREEKDDFNVPDIQNESCVAMLVVPQSLKSTISRSYAHH